jgi:hypothetical protein
MLSLRMLGASLPHCMRSMSPSILTAGHTDRREIGSQDMSSCCRLHRV